MSADALATAQLRAYNAHDLDAFCACYADDVRVLDASGAATVTGIADFRERYAQLFTRFEGVGAEVDGRLVVEPHCVERERYWRTDPDTGTAHTGEVLVRYTARDGKIAVVQFMMGGQP